MGFHLKGLESFSEARVKGPRGAFRYTHKGLRAKTSKEMARLRKETEP